ncbi:chemotaxis protein CheW [Thiosulfativibrio zosterae]|uniref:Chemotaxis protein CheW n=1 Tax=Thiosulfativibrio zosterae TaxID=2675053 RepID=A0A6F8PKA9_9GAMM|nr:chemotaxis protein CheW [Thiosulfativibrio zosterae]BBP42516.1 chemotaxis protein CheW [Thiosulfativibrio zosterae]
MADMSENGELAQTGAHHDEQCLTFLLGAETYGMDILRVQEIRGWEPTTKLPGVPDYVKGVINIRGAVVPVVDLRQRFKIGEPTYDDSTVVIITRIVDKNDSHKEKMVGLVVDGVSDVESINLGDLQNAPAFNNGEMIDDTYLHGIASVGASMVIVVNVDALIYQGVFQNIKVAA